MSGNSAFSMEHSNGVPGATQSTTQANHIGDRIYAIHLIHKAGDSITWCANKNRMRWWRKKSLDRTGGRLGKKKQPAPEALWVREMESLSRCNDLLLVLIEWNWWLEWMSSVIMRVSSYLSADGARTYVIFFSLGAPQCASSWRKRGKWVMCYESICWNKCFDWGCI